MSRDLMETAPAGAFQERSTLKLFVANRAEVALRVVRAARERGWPTVVACAADELGSPHAVEADEAVALTSPGPAAYLDRPGLVEAACRTSCTHLHPGYGFLSEDPELARSCGEAGLIFVGPLPEVLETFGDKVLAREAAASVGIPVLEATGPDASAEEVRSFLRAHPAGAVIKARSAGGGRGLRAVTQSGDVDAAWSRCAAEAEVASGRRAVFAEERLAGSQHVEVQVLGVPADEGVAVIALGDRDCSVQRRMQKIIEVAPAPWIDEARRAALHAGAVALCARIGLSGLATVEYLVTADRYAFVEVNPRLQVEHTVTEEVTGLDLVDLQLSVASGARWADLDLPAGLTARGASSPSGRPAARRGTAVECRLNAEDIGEDGRPSAAAGTVATFLPPTGAGVRVDTHLRRGMEVTGRFDPLLAKVVVHVQGGVAPAAAKALRALGDTVVRGVPTNGWLLAAVLGDPAFSSGDVTTDWVQEHLSDLRSGPGVALDRGDADTGVAEAGFARGIVDLGPEEAGDGRPRGTAPSAVAVGPSEPLLDPGEAPVRAPMLGTLVSLPRPGQMIPEGSDIAVLEAMKMQHGLVAEARVEVVRVLAEAGTTVAAGTVVAITRPAPENEASAEQRELAEESPRQDLAEVLERHRMTTDEARAERLTSIRARGRRTARQNLANLVDEGSFVEYGPLVVAAQRRRKSLDQLLAETPADGVIGGTASINGALFGSGAEAVVLSYDYSVVAGTQGLAGHDKTDRLLELAARRRLPVVLFPEGGGGRPNDSDIVTTGLKVRTFRALAELHGRVPLVAVVSGRCFAGNAALAGSCDVMIATPDISLGMGGPAMIEGGGLGRVAADDVGPIGVHLANGVVDVAAGDEEEAVGLAQRYLAFFQGSLGDWQEPDPVAARRVVPSDRLRAYDVRAALGAVADLDSVLELRSSYGRGILTALARFEGHPCAVVANDSRYLGGAIDAESARKASRFLRLANDFGLPVLVLCDTPGFMVGPEAERQASVTHFSDLFAAGAALDTPCGALVLRKAYGLGAMAMLLGHVHAPRFTVAWPTGELGPMGLEGAIRLGARRQLEAIGDPAERQRRFEELVASAYQTGKALNAATLNELDDVIDPADSRRWVRQLFV